MIQLHIVLDPKEVAELKTLLDRALNTLERHKWPEWVVELDEKLANYSRINDMAHDPNHSKSSGPSQVVVLAGGSAQTLT